VFSKHINIKTQLKQKVFTKVINLIKLGAWVERPASPIIVRRSLSARQPIK
jgi:hypothetical protein